ncbi:Multidrug and toxin extrusion protein 2 [Galdieria sulphuraria]|uniref:Multidrug resistance protein, MOP family n=1 Tax=Galdieria sulphuraria TaxID=130081 RepID=M2Y993_GALSU|nr:multidrug resistance protein, MOP family [Galdieria sulphuraria]EME32419.1 multidrug resistance protein, MOP family [Galdieria sulphuraria]GJD06086.1 Multidrug and toxin extrusion protein 2 [Galdieria sulphuraria]|eukprot:XP_005708939.1 multidrug resistance protein, MOP family [Galdieria sulphuraria]
MPIQYGPRGIWNWKEVQALLSLAIPVSITYLTFFFMYIVDTLVVGRLGKTYLAAAALANTWCNCMILMGKGILTALDPLCAQAYGAKRYRAVGIALQRGFLAMVLVTFPISWSWWRAEDALLWLGQSVELSSLAGIFARRLIPSILPSLLFDCLQKYLQSQSITKPSLIIGLICNVINLVLNVVLVFGIGSLFLGLGFVGAPIATVITTVVQFFLLWLYIYYYKIYVLTWPGWSWECLQWKDTLEFWKLGIPGALMYIGESWGYESISLLAGILGVTSLAAHNILFNMIAVAFFLYLGIGVASSTRVGNALGANLPFEAKRASWLASLFVTILGVLCGIFLYIFRFNISGFYTEDNGVIQQVALTTPLSCIVTLLDGIQTIFGGVLRGMGNPVPAVACYLVGFYIIGLPTSILLAFRLGFRLNGLWFGLMIGLLFVCIAEFEYLRRRNWVELAKRAMYTSARDSSMENNVSDNLYTIVDDLSSFTLEDNNSDMELKGAEIADSDDHHII